MLCCTAEQFGIRRIGRRRGQGTQAVLFSENRRTCVFYIFLAGFPTDIDLFGSVFYRLPKASCVD